MINPREFHIGNFYQWSLYASMGIGVDVTRSGEDIDSYPQLRDPIPLTADHLTLAGFEREQRQDYDGDPFYVWFKDGIDIHESYPYDSTKFLYATYVKGAECSFKGGWQIDTVHRLQNFYFALTNRELDINLNFGI